MVRRPNYLLLLSACVVAVSVAASASAQPPTRADDGLLGPVRSVHESWYELELVDGTVRESERGDCLVREYDREGRCVRTASLLDGRVLFATVYSYDGDRILSWQTDGRSLPSQGYRLEYLRRGTLLDEFEIRDGLRRLASRREFGREGQLIAVTVYAADGSIERRTVTVTDELGRPTTTASYSGTDHVVARSRRFYRPYMEGLESYDTTGRMRGKVEVYVDSLGRESVRLVWRFLERRALDMLMRYRSEYDDDGRRIRIAAERYSGGDPTIDGSWTHDHDTTYFYIDDGRLSLRISGAGTTQWIYDEHGNWIRMETRARMPGGRLVVTGRRREIGYWD